MKPSANWEPVRLPQTWDPLLGAGHSNQARPGNSKTKQIKMKGLG